MKNKFKKSNDGNSHYFKIVKDLDQDLEPYINSEIYNEMPGLGTYQSTLGIPHPQTGDYLIYKDGEINFFSNTRDFENVFFSHTVDLKSLLEKRLIQEVSYKIFDLDMKLSNKIEEIYMDIANLKVGLDIGNCNKDYININKLKNNIEDLQKELGDLKEEYNIRISKSLMEESYNCL
ncbi:hypothetical protein [Clostridium sporogenes]|uniref:hypothetical protein n=1 Tax=Clostridium sporogenes TaxID=1509 RepID=UPI0006B28991|nr:hypothetical protein [Clostridium sporogenes]KOY66125.1 hypothetical protein AN649_09950 [Clostridium sporogenes]MDS1006448.1 hypothetical protein [Clostridium sporogenes]